MSRRTLGSRVRAQYRHLWPGRSRNNRLAQCGRLRDPALNVHKWRPGRMRFALCRFSELTVVIRTHVILLVLVVCLSTLAAGCGGGSTGSADTTTKPIFADLVAKVRSGVVRIEVKTCDERAVGSGFLVGPRLVATVEHVVTGASKIQLKRNGKNVAVGTVIGTDKVRDLALIRTDRRISGYLFHLAGATPRLGDEVGALGFPLGLPLTVTKGSVSGLNRSIRIDGMNRRTLVQTDGNGGCPPGEHLRLGSVEMMHIWFTRPAERIRCPAADAGALQGRSRSESLLLAREPLGVRVVATGAAAAVTLGVVAAQPAAFGGTKPRSTDARAVLAVFDRRSYRPGEIAVLNLGRPPHHSRVAPRRAGAAVDHRRRHAGGSPRSASVSRRRRRRARPGRRWTPTLAGWPRPLVTRQTPGRPVAARRPTAMLAAPASCQQVISRVGVL